MNIKKECERKRIKKYYKVIGPTYKNEIQPPHMGFLSLLLFGVPSHVLIPKLQPNEYKLDSCQTWAPKHGNQTDPYTLCH